MLTTRRTLLSGAAAVTLSGVGGRAFAAASLPPVSAATMRTGLGLVPIEAFGSLAGDGVTDDSIALKAAHDAAAAAGFNEVYCAHQYNAASAYNLGLVHFRGPGALIGTYRKKIIPFSAKPSRPPNKINPGIHLKRFSKALNPQIVIIGDSTTTPTGANHISLAEMIGTMLSRAFIRDNPGRSVTILNRAIGGTASSSWASNGTTMQAAGSPIPSWYTNLAATYSAYIANPAQVQPDLVIINWGTNDAGATNYQIIDTIVQSLLSLAKVPDILFCTNVPRSTQFDVGVAEVAAQEARDVSAGAYRSYAELNGFACLDFNRGGCMARDGYDPCTQVMTQVVASQSYALPATLPMTAADYDVIYTIDNTGGAALPTSAQIDHVLSSNSGNTLRLKNNGTNFGLIGYCGANGTTFPTPTQPIAVPTGVITVELSIRGNWGSLYINGNPLWQGLMFRQGPGQFQPQVLYAVGSGVSSINVTNYVNSTPQLCAPSLTDGQMFGTNSNGGTFGVGLSGGNAVNHPTSLAYETIYGPMIDDISFTGLGQPTQYVTAAGAINADASLVELTGPATGTYAVTLAAPRVQDQGNDLVIEMVSTTSTNTVTLALTNVAGGTASTTATFNAAGQRLVLKASAIKWEVIKQDGVTLS